MNNVMEQLSDPILIPIFVVCHVIHHKGVTSPAESDGMQDLVLEPHGGDGNMTSLT